MKFQSADEAILYYLENRKKASSGGGPSMYGYPEFPAFCPNKSCGRQGPPRSHDTKGNGVEYFCGKCLTNWPFAYSYVFARQLAGGGGSRGSSAMERAGDLAPIFSEFSGTPELKAPDYAGIYTRYFEAPSSVRSIANVAEVATETRFDGRRWQESDVRRAISRSRKWLTRRLTGVGLLERCELQGVGT